MPSEHPPRLLVSQLLAPSSVALSLRGTNRDQVLRELVNLVPALRNQPSEQERLLQALIEREEMHSTGIGDGLALPHTRNTLGGLVENPMVVVGRHPVGIPFGAIDGRAVRLFFLILSTSVTEHLQLLARMSRLLRDHQLRTSLIGAPDPASFIRLVRQSEG